MYSWSLMNLLTEGLFLTSQNDPPNHSFRIVLETDPNVLEGRVSLRGSDTDVPFAEQTISQALKTAREQITKSLLTG